MHTTIDSIFFCFSIFYIFYYYLCYTVLIGRPCKLKWDPDYVPSIFSFKDSDKTEDKHKLARSHRLQKRRNVSRENCSIRMSRPSQKGRRAALGNCNYTEPVENIDEEVIENDVLSNDVDMVVENDIEESCNEFSSELYQPLKLSQLAEECHKFQTPLLVNIIHQQQQTIHQQQQKIELLTDQKKSLEECLGQ